MSRLEQRMERTRLFSSLQGGNDVIQALDGEFEHVLSIKYPIIGWADHTEYTVFTRQEMDIQYIWRAEEDAQLWVNEMGSMVRHLVMEIMELLPPRRYPILRYKTPPQERMNRPDYWEDKILSTTRSARVTFRGMHIIHPITIVRVDDSAVGSVHLFMVTSVMGADTL